VFKQLGGRPIEVTPRQPRPQGGENPYTNAYRRLLDDFVQSVAGRSDAELPREQVALMSFIEAAYRSAEAGREVEL
jgi:predicted dehydrogenase